MARLPRVKWVATDPPDSDDWWGWVAPSGLFSRLESCTLARIYCAGKKEVPWVCEVIGREARPWADMLREGWVRGTEVHHPRFPLPNPKPRSRAHAP